MSLYTKYRPKDWDSLVGQDAIAHILKNSLRLDRVGHAYIFTGSRGTGKTTSARILAEGVNCENLQNGNPCHECHNCRAFEENRMLDIIEIDAASNTSVDDIRDLIEKARFEPSAGKFKVYIIDEVHMLSDSAFNALLKTLEEPPSHVKFILATTEIDKVPETIRSRSLRFDFQKISIADIVKRLEYVVQAEAITASKGALELIAKSARGGMRDALTLLEQQTIAQVLDENMLRENLSLLESSLLEHIVEVVLKKDEEGMKEIIENFRKKHTRVDALFDQLLSLFRDKMLETLANPAFEDYHTLSLIVEDAYGKVRYIPDGQLLTEITLLRMLRRANDRQRVQVSSGKIAEPKKTIKAEKIVETKTIETPKKALAPEEIKTPSQKIPENFSYIVLLNSLKGEKPALATDLKNARFDPPKEKILILHFEKEWNYNRVNTATVKSYLTEKLDGLFGEGWSIECTLGNTSSIEDSVF